jgi:unsaturated chondroitin disaccharide hydrolase
MIKLFLTTISIFGFISCNSAKETFVNKQFDLAANHYKSMAGEVVNVALYPRTTAKDGSLKQTDMYDWTSGFYAGNLWYLYEHTGDKFWKEQATRSTESLEPLKTFTRHHDLGFMMYCSYGNAYRLTKNPDYREILIESANSLASRFNAKTGCIKSWNYRKSWDGKREWFYPVIIDNMMNLELLFFASKETGLAKYREIAIRHAETTLKNQFRPNFSTYHVVNYDTISGLATDRGTSQGYTDASTWARGQAWAVYGYTMTYRETMNPIFLNAAMQAADFFLKNDALPDDMIPYWDFDIQNTAFKPDWKNKGQTNLQMRDASAAAILSSALFELSKYANSKEKYYKNAAEKILFNLVDKYVAESGTNNNFIIKHSVGSFPHNEEIDVPLVYADYYFIEALMRYKNLK